MKKIIIIEDDALVARIYSQKLAGAGFEVTVAEDGLAAMKRLPEFKPDLVVLDLMMPKFSGLDVLKFIRQHPQIKLVRVIVFSNSFLTRLGEEVAAIGVDEMLAKAAMTPELLIEAIHRVLGTPAEALPVAPEPAKPSPAPIAPVPTVPKTPPPTPAPSSGNTETFVRNESAAAFRRRIRRDFFEQIPSINKTLQFAADEFLVADPQFLLLKLEALTRKIKFINHMTGMAGCYRIGQLSAALEALLFELQEKPATINESSHHTISSTIALLREWLGRADQPDEQCLSPTSILIVDDDAVSNRALAFALSRANLSAKSVTEPVKALDKLRESSFDAVLLDINLPGMNGFVLCECLRALPLHKHTPVIFITSHGEFESRARAIPGITDFITKPILPIELTVKVTAHVLKRRLTADDGSQKPEATGQKSEAGSPKPTNSDL